MERYQKRNCLHVKSSLRVILTDTWGRPFMQVEEWSEIEMEIIGAISEVGR